MTYLASRALLGAPMLDIAPRIRSSHDTKTKQLELFCFGIVRAADPRSYIQHWRTQQCPASQIGHFLLSSIASPERERPVPSDHVFEPLDSTQEMESLWQSLKIATKTPSPGWNREAQRHDQKGRDVLSPEKRSMTTKNDLSG